MPLRLYPRSRHRSARQSRRPAWWRNAFRIVGASRQRVGDVDGGAVEQAGQLSVEPGGDGASTRHTDPGPGPWPRPQSVRTSPPRPAGSVRLVTRLNTSGGEISRESRTPANNSAENTCDPSRSVQPARFSRETPCSMACPYVADLTHSAAKAIYLARHQESERSPAPQPPVTLEAPERTCGPSPSRFR